MEYLSEADFPLFYDLLCEAFPQTERRGEKEQRALFSLEKYKVCAKRFSGKLAAIAYWNFGDFRFVEHFAVDRTLRGGGIGSAFLREFVSAENSPCILEAELPEQEIQKRRIAFYQRNGFCLLPFSYFQPPLNKGEGRTPMLTMATESVGEDRFSVMRQKIYSDVYLYNKKFTSEID